jgi:hypothetical protein
MAIDRARAEAASGHCFFDAIGICGGYGWVSGGSGFGGTDLYFDGSGALVGARTISDANEFCHMTTFLQDYGLVPVCTPVPIEALCVGGHTDLGAPGG